MSRIYCCNCKMFGNHVSTECPAHQAQGSFAAPDGSAKYRLVSSQDAICAGDERLRDDCETWEVITNEFVGTRYNGNFFVPMRRKVSPNK